MDYLAPPMRLGLILQGALQNGTSVRSALEEYITNEPSELGPAVQKVLFSHDQGQSTQVIVNAEKRIYRRALLEVIAHHLNGQPIQERLKDLNDEIRKASDADIKRTLDLMPFIVLFPLLVFQFPAFLLLLLGPLVNRFIGVLK